MPGPLSRTRRSTPADLRLLAVATKREAFTLADAAALLGRSKRSTTLRLAALARLGLVRRLARGLYVLVALNAPQPARDLPRNTEALACALFPDSYIGGWTAAALWDLCKPYRREWFVVTSSRVRSTVVHRAGLRLHVVHVPASRTTGPGITPRGSRVRVSDRIRTLVDALHAPSWIGGARRLADALHAYRRSDRWDPDPVLLMMESIGHGAATKRLGAICTRLQLGYEEVLFDLRERRTKGIVDLEPGAGKTGPIDYFWRVRMNVPLGPVWDDEDDPDDDYLDDGLGAIRTDT